MAWAAMARDTTTLHQKFCTPDILFFSIVLYLSVAIYARLNTTGSVLYQHCTLLFEPECPTHGKIIPTGVPRSCRFVTPTLGGVVKVLRGEEKKKENFSSKA